MNSTVPAGFPLAPDRRSAGIGLSIVVPVYRGAATVGRLVDALSALQPDRRAGDRAGQRRQPRQLRRGLPRAGPRRRDPVTYIEHARNYGEHNAVMTGLRHARGDYVITMDDDLQNPPEEVVRLYDHARLGDWDVVYTRYAVKQHAGWRNLGSRFANTVADRLLDKPNGLYLSSFRCMSALVVRAVTRYEGPYPYVDGLIMQVTQRIDSIEVRHLPRTGGPLQLQSPPPCSAVAEPGDQLLARAAAAGDLRRRRRWPCWARSGAVATIAEALIIHDTPSGWASTMTVLLLVSGVQSMILGVLGEYVGRTFLRPTASRRARSGWWSGTQAAVEAGSGVTLYWLTLATAIATSMAGQTLLKAGAGATSFVGAVA